MLRRHLGDALVRTDRLLDPAHRHDHPALLRLVVSAQVIDERVDPSIVRASRTQDASHGRVGAGADRQRADPSVTTGKVRGATISATNSTIGSSRISQLTGEFPLTGRPRRT